MRIGILRIALLTAPLVLLSAPLFSQAFSGPKEIPLGKPPGTFVNLLNAGDFNNDGKTDLLLGIFEFDHTANEPLNHMLVLTGKGGAAFTTASLPGSSTFVQASAVADVNGDKNADIITAYGSTDFSQFRTGFLEVFTSDGHGHFPKTNKLALPQGTSTYLAVHDFNGDGKPDIAVLNEFADIGGFFDNLTIFLNHGNGTFMQGSVTSFAAAAGGGNQMVTGDFNGDGKFDLAYLCAQGNQMFTFNAICTLNNTGNGTFIAGPSYVLEMAPFSLATADLNGDKKWDLVVGLSNNSATPPPPNRLVTLLAKQTGNFFWYAAASTPTIPFSPTLVDLNGDGKLDVATSAEGIAVLALFGNGKGRFSGQQSYKAFSGPLDVGPLSKGDRPSLFFGVGTTSPRLQVLINKNQ